jgi:hypothetical protein
MKADLPLQMNHRPPSGLSTKVAALGIRPSPQRFQSAAETLDSPLTGDAGSAFERPQVRRGANMLHAVEARRPAPNTCNLRSHRFNIVVGMLSNPQEGVRLSVQSIIRPFRRYNSAAISATG